MRKILITYVPFLLIPNFAFCFYFLEPNKLAKALLFCFFCFCVYVFLSFPSFRYSVLDLAIYFFFFLFVVSVSMFSLNDIPLLKYVILLCLLFYWIICRNLIVQENLRFFSTLWLFSLIFVTVATSLLGLYEFFCYFHLGKSDGMLVSYLVPVNKSFRVAGIYGQPNLFSLLLLSGILSSFYTYLHDPNFSQSNCRIKYLYYLPLFVIALCFFLTGSRAGILAMLCTVMFVCLMVARKRYLGWQPELRRKFCVMLSVLALAWIGSYVLNDIFSGVGSRVTVSSGVSIESRFVFWAAAGWIFIDHPWFGIGLDNYKFFLPEYLPKAHEWLGFVQHEAMAYTNWAHNELLQLTCEGGIFVLLLLLFVLGVFASQLFKFAFYKCDWSPLKFYSHVFIIPFIIQSMFSWPLRHPGLLVIFFTFLAMLAAHYPSDYIIIPKVGQYGLKGVAFVGLMVVFFIATQEAKMGVFANSMTPGNAKEEFVEFERLIDGSYTKYPLLLHLTPRYVQVALKKKDTEFAERILPYVEKLATMQGAHWQWYNLAALYNLLGQRGNSHNAIDSAIEVRPSEGKYWAFQHYLNMQDASDKTGRPLEDFLPIPPGGDVRDLKDLFDFDGRNLIEM